MRGWEEVEASWQSARLHVEDNAGPRQDDVVHHLPNLRGETRSGGSSRGLADLEPKAGIEDRLRQHLLARGTRGL